VTGGPSSCSVFFFTPCLNIRLLILLSFLSYHIRPPQCHSAGPTCHLLRLDPSPNLPSMFTDNCFFKNPDNPNLLPLTPSSLTHCRYNLNLTHRSSKEFPIQQAIRPQYMETKCTEIYHYQFCDLNIYIQPFQQSGEADQWKYI
jgi:hypothetical protein